MKNVANAKYLLKFKLNLKSLYIRLDIRNLAKDFFQSVDAQIFWEKFEMNLYFD